MAACPCQIALEREVTGSDDRERRPFDIYFDNNATTKLSTKAMNAMVDVYTKFDANPSSLHFRGVVCKTVLQKCRTILLGLLDADVHESTVVFTSGCTEANNTVIKGVMDARDANDCILLTTPIEHDSVLNVAKSGYDYKFLRVDSSGYVDEEMLKRECERRGNGRVLVSIIGAQNEIGTIQRLQVLVQTVRKYAGPRSLVHVDATQLIGKYRVSVRQSLGDPDFVTGSAHKFHGPKGCGFLYMRDARVIKYMKPLLYGGGQEMGLRSGTENTSAIVGMVSALQEAFVYMETRMRSVKNMRDNILRDLLTELGLSSIVINGDIEHGLYNTLNMTLLYKGDHNLAWLLDKEGICVSSASACTKMKRSHVLSAIGVSDINAKKTIRVSLSSHNTHAECETFVRYVVWLYKNVLNK
ncbi:MAG: cysteine desulfurase family protein [Methylococcales bacterium]|nr:cysteine desulfurase family protein [Methylococcales bacterium]